MIIEEKMEFVERTAEEVESILTEMLEELRKNEQIIYLGQLFENKEYSRQRFSERVKKFKDHEIIKNLSDTIKEILESRAVEGAMKNKLNATFTIFHLKNNYGRKDKQEIEQKSDVNLNVNSILDEIIE